MRKALSFVFFCWFCTGAFANENDWNKVFNVIWESRWQQSGIPMSAVRWPTESKSIKFSINKSASSSNANRSREALNAITKVLGWTAIEVEEGSLEAQIEFTIRQYRDEELRQAICHASPSWKDWLYTKQKLSLSEQFAYRCVLHELMHAFGFPGHPQGETVLSYFEGNQSRLKPMDEFLLSTWYSDDIKVGASPFNTVHELMKQWVKKHVPQSQQEAATAAQLGWHQNMIKAMENFALNQGEPPTILYRSGRISEEGTRLGRANMQSMLGSAYLNGWTVEKDTAKAARLLLLGAQAGNAGATLTLAKQLKADAWEASNAKPLCQWLYNTPVATTKLTNTDHQAALDSSVCKLILAP
jgi:hypothetical protein